jgi:hypothetical protein
MSLKVITKFARTSPALTSPALQVLYPTPLTSSVALLSRSTLGLPNEEVAEIAGFGAHFSRAFSFEQLKEAK